VFGSPGLARAQWNYVLSYRGGYATCCMGRPRTREYAPRTWACRRVRAQRQNDGRPGDIASRLCRICPLCRDHVLLLIRAPDKIALCYRGSCLRNPREREREREREGERERGRTTIALTCGLPSACRILFAPLALILARCSYEGRNVYYYLVFDTKRESFSERRFISKY